MSENWTREGEYWQEIGTNGSEPIEGPRCNGGGQSLLIFDLGLPIFSVRVSTLLIFEEF